MSFSAALRKPVAISNSDCSAENERDEQALHRQVAEFLRDVGRVAARDGVCHFVSFLDQMARSVGELLFAIPCASLAQLGNDGEQFRERLSCRVVGHRFVLRSG